MIVSPGIHGSRCQEQLVRDGPVPGARAGASVYFHSVEGFSGSAACASEYDTPRTFVEGGTGIIPVNCHVKLIVVGVCFGYIIFLFIVFTFIRDVLGVIVKFGVGGYVWL